MNIRISPERLLLLAMWAFVVLWIVYVALNCAQAYPGVTP